MAFDVSKFLALTALIAGTGAACSGTDKDEPGQGGTSGSGTSGNAGQSTQGGAGDGAAAGNGGAGEGGATAAGAGGAGLGGADAGGAGGAGGATEVGECLGSLAEGGAGGAGGAPAVEPSLEGLCMDYFDTVCAGSEDAAPSYTVCEGVKSRAQPAVAVAVEECISKLSATDACDYAKVAACLTSLAGQGCANANSATACATIKTHCDEVEVASCEKIADLVNPDRLEGFTGCMDPTDEGWYEEGFTGTCVARLDFCAGARTFWQF